MAETWSNPSWKFSSVLLNGINNVPWLRVVTLSLVGKKKLGFLNGNTACPESTDPSFEDWIANNQLVRSWLFNSMEAHVAENYTFSNSAEKLWESVADSYGSQNNAARIFELKCEIASAR